MSPILLQRSLKSDTRILIQNSFDTHFMNETCDKFVTIIKLEILRKCRSVKHGLDALRQEQSSILHSLVATLTAIRREKDPDTR